MKHLIYPIIILLLVIALIVIATIKKIEPISTETPFFGIKYIICSKEPYNDCFLQAVFKDEASCQRAVEKGSWYCDESNPNNIRCRVPKPAESFATSYCSEY